MDAIGDTIDNNDWDGISDDLDGLIAAAYPKNMIYSHDHGSRDDWVARGTVKGGDVDPFFGTKALTILILSRPVYKDNDPDPDTETLVQTWAARFPKYGVRVYVDTGLAQRIDAVETGATNAADMDAVATQAEAVCAALADQDWQFMGKIDYRTATADDFMDPIDEFFSA